MKQFTKESLIDFSLIELLDFISLFSVNEKHSFNKREQDVGTTGFLCGLRKGYMLTGREIAEVEDIIKQVQTRYVELAVMSDEEMKKAVKELSAKRVKLNG